MSDCQCALNGFTLVKWIAPARWACQHAVYHTRLPRSQEYQSSPPWHILYKPFVPRSMNCACPGLCRDPGMYHCSARCSTHRCASQQRPHQPNMQAATKAELSIAFHIGSQAQPAHQYVCIQGTKSSGSWHRGPGSMCMKGKPRGVRRQFANPCKGTSIAELCPSRRVTWPGLYCLTLWLAISCASRMETPTGKLARAHGGHPFQRGCWHSCGQSWSGPEETTGQPYPLDESLLPSTPEGR